MGAEGFDFNYLWGTLLFPVIMILYSKYNLLKSLTNFIVTTNVELEVIASETFESSIVEEYVKKMN